MQTKQRDMNFEALRIIAMILIIASHYTWHGGILEELEKFSFNYLFIDFIKVLTRVSVSLYVMITGYYMVTSKIKIKKLFNIWLVVIFYSIFMQIMSILSGRIPNIKELIKSIMPISSGLYWFATAYVALYLLAPFINKLVLKMTKKQYQVLIIILFVLLVLIKTVFNNNYYIDARNGESLIWFVYIYILAGYIRLHYNMNTNRIICLLIIILTPFIITGIRFVSIKYFGKDMYGLLNFSNILNFISTVCVFLYFKEVKIKSKFANGIITKISPLMFGIYLIHENIFFRSFMWKEILGVYKYANSQYLVLHFIISIIMVFAICAAIEYLRMKLFTIFSKTKLSNNIDNKLDKLNEKFWTIMEE